MFEKEMVWKNRENRPTFVTATRREVLDVTLCSQGFDNSLRNWRVSEDNSSSDHKYITFEIKDDNQLEQRWRRNPRSTNWKLYVNKLVETKGELPHRYGNQEEIDTASLALENWIRQAWEEATKEVDVKNRIQVP